MMRKFLIHLRRTKRNVFYSFLNLQLVNFCTISAVLLIFHFNRIDYFIMKLYSGENILLQFCANYPAIIFWHLIYCFVIIFFPTHTRLSYHIIISTITPCVMCSLLKFLKQMMLFLLIHPRNTKQNVFVQLLHLKLAFFCTFSAVLLIQYSFT